MPVYTSSTVRPRAELVPVVVEGASFDNSNIWRMVLPLMPANKRNAHLIKATIAATQAFRILTDRFITAPGAKVERFIATFGDDSFEIPIRKAEIAIPNETEIDYAEFLSVEQFFARRMGKIAEDTHEYNAATALFNTTNFGAATNSASAYTAANVAAAATDTFISDIQLGIRRVKDKGEKPDTIIMSGPVYERNRNGFNTRAFVSGQLNASSEVTPNTLQRALADQGIKQVLIGDAYYNTAADGDTPSLTAIWSNTYIWIGASGKVTSGADGVAQDYSGAGMTMFWEPVSQQEGYYVESYPDPSTDSNIIRVKDSTTPHMGNTRAGTLIATQYS